MNVKTNVNVTEAAALYTSKEVRIRDVTSQNEAETAKILPSCLQCNMMHFNICLFHF